MRTHIQIRAVGRPPEAWIKEAINSYATRCSPFGKLEMMEVAEGHGKTAKPDIARTKQAEATDLMKNLPSHAWLVALDETGRQFSSQDFAQRIEAEASDGRPIVFLIGGSWGLDKPVLDKAHLVLSLGKMTLPHSLARIVLLEQIYRAHMISAGREYHK